MSTTRRSPAARPPRRAGDILALSLGLGAVALIAGLFLWVLSPPPAVREPAAAPAVTPSPDFTQQPLQFTPLVAFPGYTLVGYTLAQPEAGTLLVTLVWEAGEPAPDTRAAWVELTDTTQTSTESRADLPGIPLGPGPYSATLHAFQLPADAPGQYDLLAGVLDAAANRLPGEAAGGLSMSHASVGPITWPVPVQSPTPLGPPTPYLTDPPPQDTPSPPPAAYPLPGDTPTPWPTFTPCQVGCGETPGPPPITDTPEVSAASAFSPRAP